MNHTFWSPSHHTSIYGEERGPEVTSDDSNDRVDDLIPEVFHRHVQRDVDKSNDNLKTFNRKISKKFYRAFTHVFFLLFIPSYISIADAKLRVVQSDVFMRMLNDVPEALEGYCTDGEEDGMPNLKQRVVFKDYETGDYFAYIPERPSFFGYKLHPARIESLS